MRPTAAGRRFAEAITVGTKPNHSFWPSFAYANLSLWGSILIVQHRDTRGMFSSWSWRRCFETRLVESIRAVNSGPLCFHSVPVSRKHHVYRLFSLGLQGLVVVDLLQVMLLLQFYIVSALDFSSKNKIQSWLALQRKRVVEWLGCDCVLYGPLSNPLSFSCQHLWGPEVKKNTFWGDLTS